MASIAHTFIMLKRGEQFVGTIDAQSKQDVRVGTKLFGSGPFINLLIEDRPANEQGAHLKVVCARYQTKTPGVIKVVVAEKYEGDKKFHRSLPSWSVDTTETSI